jgi:hypothetical protein
MYVRPHERHLVAAHVRWGAEVRQTAVDHLVLRLAVIGAQVHEPKAMPFKDEFKKVLDTDGRSAQTAREVHLYEQHAHAREEVRLLTSDLQEGGQLAALAINLEHADGPIGGVECIQPAGQRAQCTAQRAVIPTIDCHVATLATRLQPGEMEVYTRHGVVLVLCAEAGCRVETVHLQPAVINANRCPSVANSGNQCQSVSISVNQCPSDPISGTQCPTGTTSGIWWPRWVGAVHREAERRHVVIKGKV